MIAKMGQEKEKEAHQMIPWPSFSRVGGDGGGGGGGGGKRTRGQANYV